MQTDDALRHRIYVLAQQGDPQKLAHALAQQSIRAYHIESCFSGLSQHGNDEMLKHLINAVDHLPLDLVHRAMLLAVQSGQAKCVQLLLPHAHPKDNKSIYLRLSIESLHRNVMEMLLPHSNIPLVIKEINRRSGSASHPISAMQQDLMDQALRYDQEQRMAQHTANRLEYETRTCPQQAQGPNKRRM